MNFLLMGVGLLGIIVGLMFKPKPNPIVVSRKEFKKKSPKMYKLVILYLKSYKVLMIALGIILLIWGFFS